MEGVRLVEEALHHPSAVRKIVYSPRLEESPRGMALLSNARKETAQAEWIYASDEALASVGDIRNHQGILAVLAKKEHTWKELLGRQGIVLLLWELQDPGNLGAIFRAAEAGGSAGLILSTACVDPYSPKVLRASMGSVFRLPFLAGQNLARGPQEARRPEDLGGRRARRDPSLGGRPGRTVCGHLRAGRSGADRRGPASGPKRAYDPHDSPHGVAERRHRGRAGGLRGSPSEDAPQQLTSPCLSSFSMPNYFP